MQATVILLMYVSAAPSGRQIDADDTVTPCGRLLRRCLETVEPMRELHVTETCGREDADKLCFQRSTSNSTRPEIDVASGRFGQFDAEHDVRNLQSASRLEDAANLVDGQSLLRHQIEHTIRHHDIGTCRLD
jgi:hypothetical protein